METVMRVNSEMTFSDRYYRRLAENVYKTTWRSIAERLPRFKTAGDEAHLEGSLFFYPDGRAKPFFGLSCIAPVLYGSSLYDELCNLQASIRSALHAEQLGDIFTFLNPASLHMTITDIDPPDIAQPNIPLSDSHLRQRLDQVAEAFARMPSTETITAHACRLTFPDDGIAVSVAFPSSTQLGKILAVDEMIKRETGVSQRE